MGGDDSQPHTAALRSVERTLKSSGTIIQGVTDAVALGAGSTIRVTGGVVRGFGSTLEGLGHAVSASAIYDYEDRAFFGATRTPRRAQSDRLNRSDSSESSRHGSESRAAASAHHSGERRSRAGSTRAGRHTRGSASCLRST